MVRLEGISSTDKAYPAGNYEVHLNVPAGKRTDAHRGQRLGMVTMFGVIEASAKGGQGIDTTFPLADAIAASRASSTWTDDRLTLTFTPVAATEAAAVPQSESSARIRRACVYYLTHE